MTYSQFKSNWLGKRVDADKVYGYQCVDLVRQYMHDCYGLPTGGAWGNAIDYWTHPNANVLTKFDKVAGSNAKQGDIVIFYGTSGNVYGHIGVVDSVNADSVYTLEQNGQTGNGSGVGGDAIRLRWIPKSRIAGLLRPKVISKGVTMTTTQLRHLIGRTIFLAWGRDAKETELATYTSQVQNGKRTLENLIEGIINDPQATAYIAKRGEETQSTEFNALGKALATLLNSLGYKKV